MIKKIILIGVIVSAFIVRFYKIDNPVADWHSWRQADTSAVSRNFVKFGINLLKPQYDDLSNVASGRENPEGLRFVEFPIYNAATATAYKLVGIFSLEVWGRILTIIASVFTLIFIYLLTKKYAGEPAGIFAAFFFAFLPYSIYYGRVILPEPSMVMFSLGSLWFISELSDKQKNIYFFLSILFFLFALLIKPTAIFFGLPILYLLLSLKKSPRVIFLYLLSFAFAFLPLLAWRLYIQRFPEGIPASSWLLNGDNIRFKGAWFRWIFGERIGKLILGYWGLVFLGIGTFLVKNKKRIVIELLGISSLLYLIIFATGNVRHDYYQIPILPTVAILCGIGLDYFVRNRNKEHSSIWAMPFLAVVLFLTFALSWYEVQGFFNINHPEIVEAGKKVNETIPQNAKVIAPYGGDTAFLYQTNRKGWPLVYDANNIDKQIALGATHYVSVNFDDLTKKLTSECNILYQNEKYVIIELKCKK